MSRLRTAAKTVLATLLALLIALWLDLPLPRTAMFCVMLVMQGRSGLVFHKSWYRLIGTAVGALMAVVLIANFAQAPLPFLLCFGAWMAVCTAGAFVFRNFQSYGFVLAGYTVCFVALPVVDTPLLVVDAALTRMVEMSVGVLCAALVSDLVFPERMADLVQQALQRRYHDLLGTLAGAAGWLHDADAGREHMLRFVGDALGLDAAHTHAGLESTALRRQRQRLRLLNHQYMGLTSTLHGLHQLLRRLHDSASPAASAPLSELHASLCGLFGQALDASAGPPQPAMLIASLQQWRGGYAERVAALRRHVPATPAALLDFDSAAELIDRLAGEAIAYCLTQQLLDCPGLADADADQRMLVFATRTDPLLAALAALRGVGVLALTSSFWLLSGWSAGVGPVLNGVASSTVFAGAPAPARMMRQAVVGAVLAFPLGLLWNFQLLPLADDWPTLCVLLLPPFTLIAVLLATPALAGFGAGMMISFMLHLGVDRGLVARPVEYVDGALGDVVGFLAAWMSYLLINPNRSSWGRRRIVTALCRQLVAICRGAGKLQRERLESASRDLVQGLTTRGRLSDPGDRWVIDWMLVVLEVGRATIDVREQLEAQPENALPLALPRAIASLGVLFAQPSPRHRAQATVAVRRALRILAAHQREGVPPLPERMRQSMVRDFHRIHSVLRDPAALLDGPA